MIRGLHNLLERKEGLLLQRARDRGISFQEIADALGVSSRQAAEQRLLKLQAGRDEQETAWLDARRRHRLGMDWSPADVDSWWTATVLLGIFDSPTEESGDPEGPSATEPRRGGPDG
jgi:hypothetical protein